MRTLLKHFILDTISLYMVSQAVMGIVFAEGMFTLFLAGFVLMLANMIIKPVLNILLLPLNMVTLGLFRWIAYAITFYLVTLVVPGFKLGDFIFKGFNSYWFSLPPITISGVFAFVAFAFVISYMSTILRWIFK